MSSADGPAVSIIVPVRNGAATLRKCLAAIVSTIRADDELIVVDDHSADHVGAVLASFPQAAVYRLDRHSGVAAARNFGASVATRAVLLFVDSDVVLHPDAIERGRTRMADPYIAAVIGAYDDNPEVQTIVSRFKNLAHHHFHRRSVGRVSSFWGACGFVRRAAMLDVGGFDAGRFRDSSIEDVEFGWRLTDRGARIELDPTVQVTHLKGWTLASLLSTDVRRRALPWVRLALERRHLPAELNVTIDQKLAAIAGLLALLLAPSAIFLAALRPELAVVLVAALFLNRQLFALFWRKGGLPLLAAGIVLQQIYYLCAVTGALAGVALYSVGFRTDPVPRRAGAIS